MIITPLIYKLLYLYEINKNDNIHKSEAKLKKLDEY